MPTPEELAAQKKAEQEALVKEIKSDLDAIVAKQITEVTDKNGEVQTKISQDFKEVNEKLAKLEGNEEALTSIKTSIDDMNKVLKIQGEKLEDLNLDEGKKGKPGSSDFTEAIKMSLTNAGFTIDKDEKGNEIIGIGGAQHVKFGTSGKPRPEFKAAHVITSADVTGLAIPTDFGVMGKDEIPVNTNDHITDFYTVRTTSRATQMSLIVEYDFEGDPAIRAETVAAPLVSLKLKSKEFKIFTTAAMATISWEENDDVPELIARIKEIVPDKIKQVMDADIITIGGDNSATPWGCLNNTHNATSFNALEYAGIGGGDADEVDLAMWMQDQCQTNDYEANGIFMGQKMQKLIASKRSTTDDAIVDPRITRSKGVVTNLYNMAVKKSRVLENKFLVSVTNMNRIGIRKNIQVVSGFNNEDLSKLQISFVFYIRYAYGSQNLNANVWTDDIPGDIVIINENAAASLARINGYAAGSDAALMTIQMMVNAGGTDVRPEELADYKVAIAAETGIADAAALQVVIDAVNP